MRSELDLERPGESGVDPSERLREGGNNQIRIGMIT
jgi:hypothetical protein